MIKEKKSKSLKNENKRSKYRKKKKVNKKKSNKLWMKHYSKILVEKILTSLVWTFTIIYFHTPSLGHNTNLLKSAQIKDSLLSFEVFNLKENFDLLTSLFYKNLKEN